MTQHGTHPHQIERSVGVAQSSEERAPARQSRLERTRWVLHVHSRSPPPPGCARARAPVCSRRKIGARDALAEFGGEKQSVVAEAAAEIERELALARRRRVRTFECCDKIRVGRARRPADSAIVSLHSVNAVEASRTSVSGSLTRRGRHCPIRMPPMREEQAKHANHKAGGQSGGLHVITPHPECPRVSERRQGHKGRKALSRTCLRALDDGMTVSRLLVLLAALGSCSSRARPSAATRTLTRAVRHRPLHEVRSPSPTLYSIGVLGPASTRKLSSSLLRVCNRALSPWLRFAKRWRSRTRRLLRWSAKRTIRSLNATAALTYRACNRRRRADVSSVQSHRRAHVSSVQSHRRALVTSVQSHRRAHVTSVQSHRQHVHELLERAIAPPRSRIERAIAPPRSRIARAIAPPRSRIERAISRPRCLSSCPSAAQPRGLGSPPRRAARDVAPAAACARA